MIGRQVQAVIPSSSEDQHRVSPRAKSCARVYTRADYHRAAKRAFDGRRRATRDERRTLDRVMRCQWRRSSHRILEHHEVRYRRHHLRKLERQRILAWGNRGIGYLMLRVRGMVRQWPCLDALNTHESGWNHRARNPSSGAGGIPQALPASKMAAAGPDWATNPRTQLRWQIDLYIGPRYGSPCNAWAFWQAHHWY